MKNKLQFYFTNNWLGTSTDSWKFSLLEISHMSSEWSRNLSISFLGFEIDFQINK